jgi:segregation and condensation protein A
LKLPREAGFHPPKNVTVASMADAFKVVLGRIEIIIKLPKIVLKTAVSIRDKIASLRSALQQGIISFHRFYDASNKQDIIVSFLAMLELVKMKDVEVQQEGLFSEITISKYSNE